MHWDAIFLKLFYDVDVSLYDVWDCRQLAAIKHRFRQLDTVIDTMVEMTPRKSQDVHGMLSEISRVNSFDELYSMLGFEYILDPRGDLSRLPDNAYDLVFSFDVLEHVQEGDLPEFFRNLYRILRPGGHSIHQIDVSDHLAYYDRSVHPKNYLRYSDECWKLLFENKVQYFNRIQRSQWLSFFGSVGLELVFSEAQSIPLDKIVPAKRFAMVEKRDLECTRLTLVHRKPIR